MNALRDPYAVWISETMLQQTQVATVCDYFIRWMERFPDVETLAQASEAEVFKYWQGLGYYSRARNILNAARIIVQATDRELGRDSAGLNRAESELGRDSAKLNRADSKSGRAECKPGRDSAGLNRAGDESSEKSDVAKKALPRTRKELEALPGIGAYTAGAILSLAMHQKEAILDGNLIRIFSRLYELDFLPTDRNNEGSSRAGGKFGSAAAELNRATAELSRAAAELSRATAELSSAGGKFGSAAAELNRATAELSSAGGKFGSAAAELNRATAGLSCATAELNRATAELSSAGGRNCAAIYWDIARTFADSPKAYMHNEALMELGRTICRAKNPQCANCPLAGACRAFADGRVSEFPPAKKRMQKDWHGTALVIESVDGKILAVSTGQVFLSGQPALPHFESARNATAGIPPQAEAFIDAEDIATAEYRGSFRHNITVHRIECDVLHIKLKTKAPRARAVQFEQRAVQSEPKAIQSKRSAVQSEPKAIQSKRSANTHIWISKNCAADFFANSFSLKALKLVK